MVVDTLKSAGADVSVGWNGAIGLAQGIELRHVLSR